MSLCVKYFLKLSSNSKQFLVIQQKHQPRFLARVETDCQFPESMSYWPFPILCKMSSGESSGPVAKGVSPASMVKSKTPRLQTSQAASYPWVWWSGWSLSVTRTSPVSWELQERHSWRCSKESSTSRCPPSAAWRTRSHRYESCPDYQSHRRTKCWMASSPWNEVDKLLHKFY